MTPVEQGFSPARRIVNAMTWTSRTTSRSRRSSGPCRAAPGTTYESRVAANTDRVLGILSDCGVRATFFVLGWVAERDPAIVRAIAAGGHEIASHGYGSPAGVREDAG